MAGADDHSSALTLHGPINDVCPWSGAPVDEASLTVYKGHVVGFCNPGCRDKFEAAISHFDAAIGALEEKRDG